MENQYVIVGLDKRANHHIARSLFDKEFCKEKQQKGYLIHGNVTILYCFEDNHALMEDPYKIVLLVLNRENVEQYVNFMTKFQHLQNIFKLVIISEKDEIRGLPEVEKLKAMCTGCIEVEKGSALSDTKALIEKTVSGENTAKQRRVPELQTVGPYSPRKCNTQTKKPSSRAKASPMCIAIIGGPGTGKSKLGNLLLEEDFFKAEFYNDESVTEIIKRVKGELIVYDVPSCELSKHESFRKRLESEGVLEKVILIYTMRFVSSMTPEEKIRLELLKRAFGERFLSYHLCLAVTFGDQFEILQRQGQTKEFTTFMGQGFKDLFTLCQNRFCLVNNVAEKATDENMYRQRVLDVINKVASEMAKGQPLNIMLLGKTGHGKSALGNTILQKDTAFVSEPRGESVTKDSKKEYSDVSGRQLHVVDTPGTMDTKYPKESLISIKKALDMCPSGFHAFLIVLRFGTRMTEEEKTTIALLERVFGPMLKEYAIVTFTHGDNFRHEMRKRKTQNISFKEYILEKETGYLKDLVKSCGDRCVIINNHADKIGEEAAKLVREIDEMLKKKNGQPFIQKFVGEEECFPGNSFVIADGWKFTLMADLKEGQKVIAFKDGIFIWSQVFMFGHSRPEGNLIFLSIATTSRSLMVSPGHHVFVSCQGKLLTKAARDIVPGDRLLVYGDHANTYREEDVQQICQKEDKGLFAPITMEGNMVVDGVLASCYVDLVPPPVAHKLLWPLRAIYRVSPSTLQSVNKMGEDGIPRWARWIINNIL